MRYPVLVAVFFIGTLGSRHVGAVVGTEVVGMGTVPEQVNVTFPDGTVQTVSPSTPQGPLFITPNPTQPGSVRLVFDFPITDGTVAITGLDGAPLTQLTLESGHVALNSQDMHALADYLQGLNRRMANDVSAYERYEEIWDSLPESTQNQVMDIWDAQEAAEASSYEVSFEQSNAVAGQSWAANTADVLVGAYLDEETGVRAQAGQQIQRSREHYAEQISQLRSEAERLYGLAQDAQQRQDVLQANLTSHLNSFGIWEKLDVFGSDPRTVQLEGQLADAKMNTLVLKGQLAATVTALENVSADAMRLEQTITLEATRNDPELLEQAAQQRFDETVALSQDLAMKKQQFVDGHNAFQGQLNALDVKIAQGQQYGLDSAVEQWGKDKVSVQTTYDLWVSGMQVAIEARGWDLQQAFMRNQADGIGPTDMTTLRSEVISRGLDVGILEFTADQLAQFRGGDAGPAIGIAQGALNVTFQPYNWRDFAYDYSNEFYVTFGSWDTFSSRYGAFWGGVGRATKDALYDITVLTAEGVDLVWEAEQQAFNYYVGTDIDLVGNENLQFVFDFANSDTKLDSKLVYETTNGIINWADRRFEMQAGSGEKGLLQGLGDAGYVVGTLAGPEEAVARLGVAGLKGGARLVYAGRVINAAEDVASVGLDAQRLINLSADANRAGDAAGAAADVNRLANVGEASGVGRLDATAPPAGPRPLPTSPALLGTRGGTVTVANEGGRLLLRHSDGHVLELTPDLKLGEGSFSVAYKNPNYANVVVKITRPAENAGVALDNFGYRVMEDADPSKLIVPKVYEQYPVVGGPYDGGVVTIVQQAPPALKNTPEILVDGMLTPGQIRALQIGNGEFIARGVVLFDTKWDNWGLMKTGPGDEYVAVALDLGSVVPVVDRNVGLAEEVTRGLYTLEHPNIGWQFGRALHMDGLGTKFDDAIDWAGLNAGTGLDLRTLKLQQVDDAGNLLEVAGTLPYNPYFAKQFPQLQTAFAPDVPLPIGTLPTPVANPFGNAFRGAETAVDLGASSFNTLPPNYFRFADAGLDLGIADRTLLPNYFRDAPTALDGSALMGNPGVIVHAPFNVLQNLNVAVGENLAPFLVRRFVIGACDFGSPETCAGTTGVGVFSFPPNQFAALSQSLGTIPGIRLVENNFGRIEQIELNDPLLTAGERPQWAIERVGFTNGEASAWDTAKAARAVTVAVIDTGVAWGHADLGPKQLWINAGEIPGNGVDDDTNGYVDDIVGWNFVDDNNLPWDLDGHGTLVAGIIAAQSNNGLGIAGINPRAKIMVLRALDQAGESKASNIAEAIVYAANNGAKVINLSVGGKELTETERLAIAHAHAQGVVVVVAAGNDGNDVSEYGPAGGSPEAIVVAASTREDERLQASNWGWLVDVTAPGLDVIGTRAIDTDLMLKFTEIEYEPGSQIVGEDRAYYRATGTSFAAPIVAGTASLMKAARPELTPVEVERMIRNSARDIGAPGIDQFTSYGLLDARAALSADAAYFLEGQINGVRVAQRNGKAYLDVLGFVRSDALASARVEIGSGDSPTEWTTVGETVEDDDALLASVESTAFTGSRVWTLRLVAEHENGGRREARFGFNIN